MAVRATETLNPDGTINLVIDPRDLLEEYQRQLAIERMFLYAPIPLLFYSPKRIRHLKKTIREHKRAHGL
jgi:hypothetical protein